MSRGSGRDILIFCLILALLAPSGWVARRLGIGPSEHAHTKRQPLKRVPQRATIVSVALRGLERSFGDEFSRFAVRRQQRSPRSSRSPDPFAVVFESQALRLRPLRC